MRTPSGRRSIAISRSSHSILRKAGLVKIAAAFPLMSSPTFASLAVSCGLLRSLAVSCGLLRTLVHAVLSTDIDRLSLLEKGPDAFTEIFRAAAQHLIAVF